MSVTLQGLREEYNHMTQKTLASLLRVDRSAISKWESGKQVPDREMAMRIAQVFNRPFGEIDAMFCKTKPDAILGGQVCMGFMQAPSELPLRQEVK